MWLEHLDVFNISLVQLDPSPSKCIQGVQTSLECSKACKTFVLQKVGWLDYYCASWRPEWTLTFWVNQTFWDGFRHNPKSNDLTKIKPSLIWKNPNVLHCSFGYPTTNTATTVADDTTHLSNQLYQICIRRTSGYCYICYTPTSGIAIAASFGLSITSTDAMDDSELGSNCITDYLTIPDGTSSAIAASTTVAASTSGSRFCGRHLNPTTGEMDDISVCSKHLFRPPYCLKMTQNVSFEFLNFGIFHQFLSYENWPA